MFDHQEWQRLVDDVAAKRAIFESHLVDTCVDKETVPSETLVESHRLEDRLRDAEESLHGYARRFREQLGSRR